MFEERECFEGWDSTVCLLAPSRSYVIRQRLKQTFGDDKGGGHRLRTRKEKERDAAGYEDAWEPEGSCCGLL